MLALYLGIVARTNMFLLYDSVGKAFASREITLAPVSLKADLNDLCVVIEPPIRVFTSKSFADLL